MKNLKTVISLIVTTTLFCTINAFTQNVEDTTDWRFHDDLLNHLVGKWDITGVMYGRADKGTLEAEWVMDHQYLRIHEKSEEVVPEINKPYETEFFIGFNRKTKRYVVHEMDVCGSNMNEGLFYARRTGNELTLEKIRDSLLCSVQRFTWEPASGGWHIEIRLVRNVDGKLVNDGKEGEPVVDLKAVTVKSSPN
jgi:hypothetical protein